MFTGIIEELGSVTRVSSGPGSSRLTVRGPLVTSDARAGASIAVNGVCLTVTGLDGADFSVDVMPETLHRSTLGRLHPGDPVNLERAMRADGRFGGHVVQGHVDGTATLVERTPADRWEVLRLSLPGALAAYVVEKGSVTLDGVSLTVVSVDGSSMTVSLIPETLARTTLGTRAVGDEVNVEVDVLAKYVERLLAVRRDATGVSR